MANPNTAEYKSVVGLDDLYIAEVTDGSSSYSAESPEYFAPAAEASISPAFNREVQYADDRPFDVVQSEGESEIQLTVTALPPEMLAQVLGETFDSGSGRVFDTADPSSAPEYALGFRSKKSDGTYRYYWFLKGRFSKPSEEFATQGETPDIKQTQIVYTAIKTEYEFDLDGSNRAGVKRVYGDSGATNFDATGWFTEVQTPSVTSYSALALDSSTPADSATDVSVSADITLTFNNAVVSGAINNISLLDDSQDPVATTNSLSTNRLVITVDPDANLSASTTYTLVIAGVTDIYGQTLSTTIDFTTAA
jgi:phi13 family phage major tail protein